MLDAEAIATLQNFLYGIAENCIVAATAEWKKLKEDKHAQQNAAWLSKFEHSKAIATRISQKISESMRQLDLSKAESELVLPLASDPVLSADLAQQIVRDTYTPGSITRLILHAQPGLAPRESEIVKLAGLLIEGIQSAIAAEENLHRVKQLRFQAQTTETLADMRAEMQAQGETNAADFLDIKQRLALLTSGLKGPLAEGFPGGEHLKTINQKRFERARAELIGGSIVSAERQHRDLVADLESQGDLVDKTLLFRAYTNLGSSIWQQFRRDEAIPWFEKACVTKPDEPKAKTNKALCHVQRKEFPEAISILERARAADPNAFDPVHLLSSVCLEQGDGAGALKILNERVYEANGYFSALAQAYIRNEEFAKAAAAARKALEIDGKSLEAQIVLANSLGFPLAQRRMLGEERSLSLTGEERSLILEAIKLSETAAKTLRNQDRHFQLGELLTNLSAFYELVGDGEKAAEAAKEAAGFAPNSASTLTNLWAAQMRSGKYADAYHTAGHLMQVGEMLKGKLRQLEALLMNSEAERLLQECDDKNELTAELHKDPKFFELRANAFFQMHQSDLAFATIKDSLTDFPDDARLIAARAFFLEELGQVHAAQEDLERAEKCSSSRNRLLIVAHVAMFFYRQKQWAQAADRFVKVGADSIHSPLLGYYLTCLHNAGSYSQCFSLATEAIAVRPTFDAPLYELAARSAYNSDDLTAAENYLNHLVRRNTGEILEHQKMLAQVYLRLDEPGKAYDILKKAHAQHPKDVNILIGLSFVETLRKEHKEAVGHANEAVKTAPNDVRSHLAIFRTGLDCSDDFKFDEEQKKAFNASLQFLQEHPSGYIKAIPFEKDLKSIIAMVKARSDYGRQIEKLVRERNLPMAFLAQQLNLSPFQAWMGLVGHSNLHVHMAYGTTEEQTREVDDALRAKAVCVDEFALLTLRLLNRLDLLPKLFPKILAHTATLESVASDIREMEAGKPALSIRYHEGRLVRSEITPEQLKPWLTFLQDIRNFLKSQAAELASLDPTTSLSEDMRQAKELLGPVAYEPILVAHARKVAFYGDDAPMRSLALTAHHIPTFCTQALLRIAREKCLLTDSEYEDCIIKLLRHNYHFVSESAETLIRLAQTENFEITGLSRQLLSRATQPGIDQTASIRILSEFFFLAWRSDFSRAVSPRDHWLELCLGVLLKANQPEKLFPQFLTFLGIRALCYPHMFGGSTHWVLRSGRLSPFEKALFYLTVQKVILQMTNLVAQEFPWPRVLQDQWFQVGRMNVMLDHNGWI